VLILVWMSAYVFAWAQLLVWMRSLTLGQACTGIALFLPPALWLAESTLELNTTTASRPQQAEATALASSSSSLTSTILPSPPTPESPHSQPAPASNTDEQASSAILSALTISGPQSSPAFPLTAGLGLGAAVFLMHTLAGDTTVLARYTGQSVMPLLLTSLVTTASIAVGLLGSETKAWSVFTLLAAVLSVIAVQIVPSNLAFLAGCPAIALVSRAMRRYLMVLTLQPPSPATLFLAMLLYTTLLFASVWTVAYNFVPYGELLRESAHLVLSLAAVCLCLPLSLLRRSFSSPLPPAFKTGQSAVTHTLLAIAVAVIAWRLATAVPITPTPRNAQDPRLFSA
jgi:hypothetical protein